MLLLTKFFLQSWFFQKFRRKLSLLTLDLADTDAILEDWSTWPLFVLWWSCIKLWHKMSNRMLKRVKSLKICSTTKLRPSPIAVISLTIGFTWEPVRMPHCGSRDLIFFWRATLCPVQPRARPQFCPTRLGSGAAARYSDIMVGGFNLFLTNTKVIDSRQ